MPADDRETFDALGRAWAAGLLHPEPTTAKAMLDAGRRLGADYWRAYGFRTPDSLARFQPSAGVGVADDDQVKRREERLAAALACVSRLGRPVRAAFDQLVVDINPDAGPAWLDRIIAAHRTKQVASEADYSALGRARDGLAEIA